MTPGLDNASPDSTIPAPSDTRAAASTALAPTPAKIHNPALDGLRAIAVLAVFVHHMGLLPGGYLGVDLFLVLSGFLITGLLLAERDRTGRISLRAFWGRRAFRLLPAFYVFAVVGVPLVLLLKDHSDQVQFLWNGLASVFYVANIQRTFDPPGGDSWFGHTWTLSMEEQFYLLWPLALVVICGRSRLRRRLPTLLIGAILLVVIWRELLIVDGQENLRIYFGPDSRVDSLLVGCLLGVWRHQAVAPPALGWSTRGPGQAAILREVARLGPAALMALVALFVFGPDLHGKPNWLAYGGYTVVAAVAAVAVLAADQQRPARLARVLSTPVLSWIGRISYSFYLWHFPVTGTALDKLMPRVGRVPAAGVALAISMGLASASYYFVERPVQRRRPAWTNPGTGRVPRQRAEAPAEIGVAPGSSSVWTGRRGPRVRKAGGAR
ncbi:acyltransferase [Frankia sp. AiPs1]|uniref:acyltransferase family protein n=1 Tax=Frankia sp. AiPs1 TaxID=573493 RepID=UPI002044AE91|nr:acyltransferase [Frankia sp. AiPs1]MCM3922566.1 acyltransferase [Frankia sp. AiPs1]